ncbi:phosphonopyruvate decarboxylase [Bacteroides sp.]|uniref:phosphonopyruvate decarboxylase n=1 Tax=Bacteroides sp. TaxID=29523 RepID=UPI003AB5E238
MVNQEYLFQKLADLGIDFFTGVPDSLLNDFCLYALSYCDKQHHIIAANEGNAVSIAAGYYLGTGKIPIVYMQNSGIGNAMNPLLSLTHQDVYSIPMILVIGWRGDPSVKDHVQHKRQGELSTALMDDMNIPYTILDKDETVAEHFEWAAKTASEISAPVALIAKKGILSKAEKDSNYPEEGELMNREDAIDVVFNALPSTTIYSATTGRATRELHEMFEKRTLLHNREFLNVGSMGHCSSVLLGMAVACERQFVCFDGDSAALMHLGAFTTIGTVKPKHYLHIILNNGAHESVGGQPSAGQFVDLTTIASAAGYHTVGGFVDNAEDLKKAVVELSKLEGPSFIDVHIRKGIRSRIPNLHVNLEELKVNLMRTLMEENGKK